MISNNSKKKEKRHLIVSWIMVIFGIFLILPGGYYVSVFLPWLFSRALESTEALFALALNCVSGLVLLIGILLIFFGLRRLMSKRKTN